MGMLFIIAFAFLFVMFKGIAGGLVASATPPSLTAVAALAVTIAKAALPLFIGFLCWLASGVLNWFLHWESAQDWDAWAGKNPHKAFLVMVCRLAGLHVRPLITAWATYMAALAKQHGVDPALIDPANPPKA